MSLLTAFRSLSLVGLLYSSSYDFTNDLYSVYLDVHGLDIGKKRENVT